MKLLTPLDSRPTYKGQVEIMYPLPRFRFYGSPQNYWLILKSLLSGTIQSGNDIERLESKLCETLGVAHAVAVPQCRVGIYLALKQLLRPGQEVIMSPFTIYDAVNMVIAAGGVPVFADVEQNTCNIGIDAARSLINENTGGIIVTHLHGLAAETRQFREFCDAHGIWLAEDAAQAFGAQTDGHLVGSIGDVGIFSFGRAKNINGFFGGAVVTNSDEIARGIRRELATYKPTETLTLLKRVINCLITDLSTTAPLFQILTFRVFRYAALHGIESMNKLVNTEDGATRRNSLPQHYKRRMTPVQARIILNQLDDLGVGQSARLQIAEIYDNALQKLNTVATPPFRTDGSHIYLSYPIQVTDRREFIDHMMRNNLDVAMHHYHNCADLSCFSEFYRDCPVARKVAAQTVMLPTYPGFSTEEASRSVAAIVDYERKTAAPLNGSA